MYEQFEKAMRVGAPKSARIPKVAKAAPAPSRSKADSILQDLIDQVESSPLFEDEDARAEAIAAIEEGFEAED